MPVIAANHTPQNFEAVQGDSLDIKVTATVKSTGLAMDLTGATIKWLLNLASPLTLETPTNIEVTDATAGEFTIHIDAGELSEVGDFTHQCEVTLGGTKTTIFTGTARITTDYVT